MSTFSITTSKAKWYTLAAYLNYQINETKRLSFRAETFIDQQGFKTSLATPSSIGSTAINKQVQINALTITYGYLVDPALELRAEARLDRATLPSGVSGIYTTNFSTGATTNNASSASVQAVYKF